MQVSTGHFGLSKNAFFNQPFPWRSHSVGHHLSSGPRHDAMQVAMAFGQGPVHTACGTMNDDQSFGSVFWSFLQHLGFETLSIVKNVHCQLIKCLQRSLARRVCKTLSHVGKVSAGIFQPLSGENCPRDEQGQLYGSLGWTR